MGTESHIRQAIIEAVNKRAIAPIKADTSFAGGGIDSISMAEISFELEKQFGIRFDEDVVDVDTIDELTAYVQQRMKHQPNRLAAGH